MKAFETTVEELDKRERDAPAPVPGVVLVYSLERPMCQPFPLADGALELGRAVLPGDDRCSRQHARVELGGGLWRVTDLDSRNGSYLDGQRLLGAASASSPRVLRIGRSLFLFAADVTPYQQGLEISEGKVLGPRLREAHAAIERAATFGDCVFIRGESGSGKELAAQRFHRAQGREGRFVAVNCAAIPEGLAERLLFGAKKGAYSGAVSDAEGYLQAAHGGTLFLDEVAELDRAVQAKLLRVLEAREVLPLGDAHAVPVDLRVCSATHRDLRAAVADGRFREDLYFRLGRPEVRLPPLRERLEEIPWLVAETVEKIGGRLAAHPAFVEACLLRPWPGNVRELVAEVRRAVVEASALEREMVELDDLAEGAGARFGDDTAPSAAASEELLAPRRGELPSREAIEDALRAEGGNVTRAAKRLGLHRNQLRRWLEKNQVDPRLIGADQPD